MDMHVYFNATSCGLVESHNQCCNDQNVGGMQRVLFLFSLAKQLMESGNEN